MNFKVENIGLELKKARKENSLTLKIVAESTGLTSGFISRIENGSSIPSLNTLIKLCKAYSKDINNYINIDDIDVNKEECSFNLRQVLINGIVNHNNKEVSIEDKLLILKFANLITSSSNKEYKDIIASTLSNLEKINNLLEV